ncbi:MAG: ferrochelatase [Gammaproteobacteria bacterium]|nr:ferrochelatase [Gammaproteobacteria bacterium]NVK89656.1 ferrochelatase [Gammaproteobacteria bacterium]
MSDHEKTGVLLVNLGTPDEPTSAAVRRYLGEFLHDYRVVDLSRWIWCPVLHGIILRVRPPKVAKLYQSIWTEQGSPLMVTTSQQAKRLQQQCEQLGLNCQVEFAMTYGSPAIKPVLTRLAKACKRVIVIPLYPQFSSATTMSVHDRIAKALADEWNMPAIDFVRDYHQHPSYIRALANSVRDSWQTHGQSDKLLISFHGIPKRYADNGDNYPQECRKTAELLAEELQLSAEQWICCFQSRFGREEWLQPYTDETMAKLGETGGSLDVICPGFAADCLETLEEIQVENQEIFKQAGGGEYRYIPCLNDRDDHIQLLCELVQQHL